MAKAKAKPKRKSGASKSGASKSGASKAGASKAGASKAGTNKAKVLVVEDNPALAEIMRTFLNAEGFTVVEAGNGLDAVQLTRQESPDVILMDLQLPVMSGLEAMRRIRHIPEFGDTPIIAITGFATDFDAGRAREAGCDEFMHKPYDLDAVLEAVQRLLR